MIEGKKRNNKTVMSRNTEAKGGRRIEKKEVNLCKKWNTKFI